MTLKTLSDFWQENIKKNLNKISVIIGDLIITIFAILLFAVKAELDAVSLLIMVLFAIKPYFNTYINIVFKGEADMERLENLQLKQQIANDREISEYKILIASHTGKVENGIIANKDWNDANEALNQE